MSGLLGRRAKVAGTMQGVNDEVADGAHSVTKPVAAIDRVEFGIRQNACFEVRLLHVAFGIDHCGSPVCSGGPSPQSVVEGVSDCFPRRCAARHTEITLQI